MTDIFSADQTRRSEVWNLLAILSIFKSLSNILEITIMFLHDEL
jgi:hypothetical protein